MKAVVFVVAVVLSLARKTAAWYPEDEQPPFYFFRSQVRPHQDWCFGAPDRWPEPENYVLRFGLCDQYFDEYASGQQAWRLDDQGKMRPWEYEDGCVAVSDTGKLRLLRQCNEDEAATFVYNSATKQLKFNETHCVANQGTTPEVGDAILVLPCSGTPRFRFDMVEGQRFWQILGDVGGCGCAQPEWPAHPRTGDQVEFNECSWGLDAWRYESTETDAVLLHIRQHDSLCMQAGLGGDDSPPPRVGTEIVLYPCDKSNERQRFVQTYGTGYYDYVYSMKLESYPDLCVSHLGDLCNDGDALVLKDCSGGGVEIFYDDEGR